MSFLPWAQHYIQCGIPVFPVHGITPEGHCTCNKQTCSHPGKHPAVNKGYKSATTDLNQINQWWHNQPLANIGIPTGAFSGLYVVDIDKKHDGFENYNAFNKQYEGPIPEASLVSATGGGGFHLIYGAPSSGVAVKSTTNLGGLQGVDFRGDGGYIVAPPSLHSSQNQYLWCEGKNLSSPADLAALTPLPQPIVDLFNKKSPPISKTDGVASGGRNDHLFKAACQFRRSGVADGDLYQRVWEENLSACKPPLGEDEVKALVESSLQYENKPTTRTGKSGDKDKDPEPTEILLELTTSLQHQYWVDKVKKEYVTLPVEKSLTAEEGSPLRLHYENWPIRSKEYRNHLSRLYRKYTTRLLPPRDLDYVITHLSGEALFDQPEHDTYIRTARYGDRFFIDLTNARWEVIEISKDGWSLCEGTPPVKFLRSSGAQPLPLPDPTGTFDSLKDVFKLKNDDDYILLAAWMVYVLAGSGPYPILAIEGTAGSSKSTLSRHLRMLLDPRRPALQSSPNKIDDLYVSANNTHLIAIDNLSSINQKTSDIFCGIATGTGTSKRELYTDSDEVYFELCKPILFNSINPVIESADLADRSIRLLLQPIVRDSKEAVDEMFEKTAPKILGALFTAISTALPIYRGVTDLPPEIRMIDFAQWAVAAGDKLATHDRNFVDAFMANHHSSNMFLFEENVLYTTLLSFIQERREWSGTPTALLQTLMPRVERNGAFHSTFPSVASQLTKELNKGVTLLKLFGIQFSHSDPNNHRNRNIKLSYTPPASTEEKSIFGQQETQIQSTNPFLTRLRTPIKSVNPEN